jgi:cytochrome c-type biogenesis protein CcmH/NrfG
MKLVKLFLVVAVVIAAVILWKHYGQGKPAEQPTAAQNDAQQKPMSDDDKPRTEEKYGFTSREISP